MEKISGIVPASKRQVWQSGEIEKPRRIADPVAETKEAAVVRHPFSAVDVLKSEEMRGEMSAKLGSRLGELPGKMSNMPSGSRLNMTA